MLGRSRLAQVACVQGVFVAERAEVATTVGRVQHRLAEAAPLPNLVDRRPAESLSTTSCDPAGLLLRCGLNVVALEEGVFGISQGGIAAAALDVGEIGSDAGAVLKDGVILQMKMEVGLAGIAAVAAEGEHLAPADLVAAVDAQGAGLEMRVDGVLAGALVNDQAVSDGARWVNGAWLVIGDAVDRGDDGAGGCGQDLLPVNKVIFVAATGIFVREVVGTFDNYIGGAALAMHGDVAVDLFVVAAPKDVPLAAKRKLHGGAAARDGRRVGRRTGTGRGHG